MTGRAKAARTLSRQRDCVGTLQPMRTSLPWAAALLVILAACSNTTTTSTIGTPTTTIPATTTTSPPATTTTSLLPSAGDGPSGTDLAGAVFGKTTLDTFRSHTDVRLANNPDGSAPVVQSVIDAAYQRSPDAVAVDVVIDGSRQFAIIGVEERYFLDAGTGWAEEPLARQLLSLASTSLLAPETVSVILPLLDEVGEEDVAGRTTVHYRGGPETLEVLLNASEDPAFASFTTIEYAAIDLWVDKAGFLAKAIYDFGGVRASATAPEYYLATFEILEYDAELTIELPIP